jgi:hypothetical protein
MKKNKIEEEIDMKKKSIKEGDILWMIYQDNSKVRIIVTRVYEKTFRYIKENDYKEYAAFQDSDGQYSSSGNKFASYNLI